MAVFMTQNAPGLRTSPVKRGHWLVLNVLGEVIPPPPPVVPELPKDEATMDLAREMHMQDLRERIERDAYDVDPHAIADAIVARLMTATRAEQSCERPRD